MTAYETVVLADTPALYWPLDEAMGATVAVDLSGNGLNGTYGATMAPGGTGIVTGSANAPLPTDSTTAYVVRPGVDASLAVGTGDFALEYWSAAAPGAASLDLIGRFELLDLAGVFIYIYGPMNAAVRSSSGAGTTTVNTGAIHHIVLSRTSGVATVYIDNNIEVTFAATDNVDSGISPVFIVGETLAGAYCWLGSVAHVAWYTHALTHTQVHDHFVAGGGFIPPPPPPPSRAVHSSEVGRGSESSPHSEWSPTHVISENLGSWQIVANGQDLTYYRGVPTQIKSITFNEPFGDGPVVLEFPQITPFEPMPSWFKPWMNIDINIIRLDHSVFNVWEGMVASIESSITETGFTVAFHCIGALYQLDNYVRAPSFKLSIEDIGAAISRQFDHGVRPALRTGPCNNPFTGIGTSRKGFWNPTLTGYIQDLLTYATAQMILAGGELICDSWTAPGGNGYYMIGTAGTVNGFGPDTYYYGSIRDLGEKNPPTIPQEPAQPPLLQGNAVGIALTPSGKGYWLAASDGGIFALGDAQYLGNPGPGDHTLPAGHKIVDIQSHPTTQGYWLLSDHGEVYTFGVPYYGGSPGGATTMVGFDRTATGLGYAMMDSVGHVYCFGDAPYFGGGSGTGYEFVAIANRPQMDGYWLCGNHFDATVPPNATLDVYGAVFGYGAAVTTAWGASPPVQDNPATDVRSDLDGGGFWVTGQDGGVFTGGHASFFGSLPGYDANVYQWTLTKLPGRIPYIHVRDWITRNWHVTLGTPGVQTDFSKDWLQCATTLYGEGVDYNGCHWRNSMFPVLPTSQPTWPGRFLRYEPGNEMTGADVNEWQYFLHDYGYPFLQVTGKFDGPTDKCTRQFQSGAGRAVTGIVDPGTWATAFQGTVSIGPEATQPFFQPLAENPATEPHLYDISGNILGPNPQFDPSVVRVETFFNFGEKMRKSTAIDSAINSLVRDGKGTNPGWTGTIHLTTDPEEGSRFLMKAGQNIVVRSVHGTDVRLHIAQVQMSPFTGSVDLTVDEHNRDLMTLGAVWARDRDTQDLGRRQRMHHHIARMVHDTKAMWDCEGGSGIIPRTHVSANSWTVLKLSMGEVGDIAFTQIYATNPIGVGPDQDPALTSDNTITKLPLGEQYCPAAFAFGVFDAEVTPDMLANVVPDVPVTSPPTIPGPAGDPSQTGFWDGVSLSYSLIMNWGGDGALCGYYPFTQADTADPPSNLRGSPTGIFVDAANWYFISTNPPWLYLAVWTDTDCFIQGSFYPSTTTQ